MKEAPIPEINVKTSFNKIEETARATSTSVKRIMVEFTGEMLFREKFKRETTKGVEARSHLQNHQLLLRLCMLFRSI